MNKLIFEVAGAQRFVEFYVLHCRRVRERRLLLFLQHLQACRQKLFHFIGTFFRWWYWFRRGLRRYFRAEFLKQLYVLLFVDISYTSYLLLRIFIRNKLPRFLRCCEMLLQAALNSFADFCVVLVLVLWAQVASGQRRPRWHCRFLRCSVRPPIAWSTPLGGIICSRDLCRIINLLCWAQIILMTRRLLVTLRHLLKGLQNKIVGVGLVREKIEAK